MLRIYPVILEVVAALVPVIKVIERHDRDLANQIKRARSSVALNTAEGMYSRGGNRNARYHTALGSTREVLACLEVATAAEYIAPVDPMLVDTLRRIIGTLANLIR